MHDLKRMKESHSYYNLLTDLGCIVLVEEVVIFDELKQISPFDQLGDDVYVGLGLNAFLELEKQRVGDDLHDATLVAE